MAVTLPTFVAGEMGHLTAEEEAISVANKKRIISKKTRKKLSDSHKGKRHSMQTRIKISERIRAYRRRLREQYNQEADKIQLRLWEE